VADGRVVFTPKTLVDKRLDRRIAESAEDVAAGRSDGPFASAEAMVTSLRAKKYDEARDLWQAGATHLPRSSDSVRPFDVRSTACSPMHYT